jgi:hypothetical protein
LAWIFFDVALLLVVELRFGAFFVVWGRRRGVASTPAARSGHGNVFNVFS